MSGVGFGGGLVGEEKEMEEEEAGLNGGFRNLPISVIKKKGDRTYSRRTPVVVEDIREERKKSEWEIPKLSDLPRLSIKYKHPKDRNLDPEEKKRRNAKLRLRNLLFTRTRRAIMKAMLLGQDPYSLLKEKEKSEGNLELSCSFDMVMFEELVNALRCLKREVIEKYFNEEKERRMEWRRRAVTEEKRKELNRNAALKRYLQLENETPKQREERLQLVRQRYRMRMAAMSEEELEKWREAARKTHQRNLKNKKKFRPRTKERRAKEKERRERMKAEETPEERQQRLDACKINERRRCELKKLEKTGLTREDAVARLKTSRPDLFPVGPFVKKPVAAGPKKAKPYQPKEFKNGPPSGMGRPSIAATATPEELQKLLEKRERRERQRLEIIRLVTENPPAADVSNEIPPPMSKSGSSSSNNANVLIHECNNDNVVEFEVESSIDISWNSQDTSVDLLDVSSASEDCTMETQNDALRSGSLNFKEERRKRETELSIETKVGMQTLDQYLMEIECSVQPKNSESDDCHFSTYSNAEVNSIGYENGEVEIDLSTFDPCFVLELEDDCHGFEPEAEVEHLDPVNDSSENDNDDIEKDTIPSGIEQETMVTVSATSSVSTGEILKNGKLETKGIGPLEKDAFCELCNRKFRSRATLYYHNTTRHIAKIQEPSAFPCPLPDCTSKFPNSYFLWRHYITVHNPAKNNMEGRSRGQRNAVSVMQEGSEKLIEESLICPFCGKRFANGVNVVRHINEVHGEDAAKQKHFCEQCGKMFKQKCTLDDHIRRVHLGMKNLCEVCGRELQSPVKLWKHKVDLHGMKDLEPSSVPGIKILSCMYCEARMFRGMPAHVEKEHPEEWENFLKARAIKTDNGKKYHYETNKCQRHQCDFCDKTFTRLYTKRLHIHRNHRMNDKAPRCNSCAKTFKDDMGLIKHYLNLHTRSIDLKLKAEDGEVLNCRFCSTEIEDIFLYKLHIIAEHKDVFIQLIKDKEPEWEKERNKRGKKSDAPRSKAKPECLDNGKSLPKKRRRPAINKQAFGNKSNVSKSEILSVLKVASDGEPPRRSQRKRIPSQVLRNTSYALHLDDDEICSNQSATQVIRRTDCADPHYSKYFKKFPHIEWKTPVLKIKRLKIDGGDNSIKKNPGLTFLIL